MIAKPIEPTDREPVPGRDHSKHFCQRKFTDRATLVAIARQAMIDRGIEPDFTPAAQQESR